jgi:hypothetical protein
MTKRGGNGCNVFARAQEVQVNATVVLVRSTQPGFV